MYHPRAGREPLGVAVIGCGLIGRRRAQVVARSAGEELAVVVDVDPARAAAVAAEVGCPAGSDWRAAIARDDVSLVVVSTTHNWLAPIAVAALRSGKHVLVEKPMARAPAEAAEILRALGDGEAAPAPAGPRRLAADGRPLVAKVGFNLRFHPAIRKARALVDAGAIGDLLFIRSRYGHGGKPGFERAWRTDPDVSGGGELLDQGVHAIDLFHWFLGDFAEVRAFTATYAWLRDGGRANAGGCVEDNAFALFRTERGQIASLHASWTQWKNHFSFEVFGRDGYAIVEGLGGSYGTERLTLGRRTVEGGVPAEEVVEFPGPDTSWDAEWREFVAAVREGRDPLGSAYDGWRAITTIAAAYDAAGIAREVAC